MNNRRNAKYKKVETKVERDGGGYGYYATKAGTDAGIYGHADTKEKAKRKAANAKGRLLNRWLKGEW